MAVLERGPLRLEAHLDAPGIDVLHAGRPLLRGMSVWACEGAVHDRFVALTEGVVARPVRRALVDGPGLARRLHLPGGRGVVARPGPRRTRAGVAGIKADDGDGWYVPDDVRLADGTTGAASAWRLGGLYRRSMQRALDEAHGPGRGVVFGRSGWSGRQATGVLWGGDQASASGRCARW